jgi:hypothetical protein
MHRVELPFEMALGAATPASRLHHTMRSAVRTEMGLLLRFRVVGSGPGLAALIVQDLPSTVHQA